MTMAKKKVIIAFTLILLLLACNKYSRNQFTGFWKVADVKISTSSIDSTQVPQFFRGLTNFFAGALLKNLRFDIKQDSAEIIFSKLLDLEEKYYWTVHSNQLIFTNDSDTISFEIKKIDKDLMKLKLESDTQDSIQIYLILLREQK